MILDARLVKPNYDGPQALTSPGITLTRPKNLTAAFDQLCATLAGNFEHSLPSKPGGATYVYQSALLS